MVGDSIAASRLWKLCWPLSNVATPAVSGSTSDAALVQATAAPRAEVAVLSSGINDLRAGRTPEEVIRNLDATLTTLSAVTGRVIVLGLPGVGEAIKAHAPRWRPTDLGAVNRDARIINAQWEKLCAARGAGVVMLDAFATSGWARSDGLHFSALGYLAIFARVQASRRNAP
jgi:lysophospholipase L1-like esterase